MRQYQRFFSVLFFCFVSLSGMLAQSLESFSEAPADFLKELDKFINSNNRDDCKAEFASFQSLVNNGTFSADEFASIRANANAMLDRRMRAYPYFFLYIKSINTMNAKGLKANHFNDFMSVCTGILTDLSKGKYSPYKNYLTFTVELFDKNAIYYTRSGAFWRSTTSSFELKYEEKTPNVVFGEGELIGMRKADSIIINNTSGIYYPWEFLWKGDKGSVSWERTGVEQVYAEFENYRLEAKKTGYQVENAVLHHQAFFDAPVQGKFEDKIIIGSDPTGKSYPRFTSTAGAMKIDDLGEGVEYIGAFGLSGPNVVGRSTANQKSQFNFYSTEGKLAVTARAETFLIRKGERIVSDDAEVSVYFDQDSIFHPSINLRFEIPDRRLSLKRGDQGSSGTPFKDSHHEVDIAVESINWSIDADSIEIGTAKITGYKKAAELKSLSYYNALEYRRFQNIADRNPISTLKVYCETLSRSYGEPVRVVDANSFATKLNPRYQLSTIIGLINNLVEEGFIYYNSETEEITVTEKVFLWADASVNKVDYDIIRIGSNSKQETNGILRLEDNSLDLKDVRNIIISDSQLVVMKPFEGNIRLKADRDMEFDGQTYAGFGIFTGRQFKFNYDQFNMELDSIDSFVIRVPEGEDSDGTPLLRPITTKIENTTGTLQIDAPGNKSGKQNIPEYPSFRTTTNSYTYYSNSKAKKDAYSKDELFFELEPFTFDSLDFFDPSVVQFEGQMVSGGIFPDFNETLKVQPDDFSLGFTTETPEEGFELYEGKGRYFDEITLNNDGLTGKGEVNYLTAKLESEDIVFLPENLQATAKTLNIEEQSQGVEFPGVNAENVNVDWAVYKDTMNITSKEDPFLFFDEKKKLDGGLKLSPGGLYGSGKLDWEDATMTSKLMKFGVDGVDSDTCNLGIKSLDAEKLAFNTKNVKAQLDFKTQKGSFEANSEDISTEMPYNQYKTSLNAFEWDMQEQKITFNSKDNKEGLFLSTRKDQDSLLFTAKRATYDLKTNLLEIEGVPNIMAADAIIYPNDGKISIMADAEMQPLVDAKIVANTQNRYHTINKAEVKILGRTNYRAKGYYEYNVAGKEQEILFNDIVVQKKKKKQYVTKGSGDVEESADFLVDDRVKFKGTVNLSADSKNLEFKGFAKLVSPLMTDISWFNIESQIDRNNVIINYDDPKDPEGQRLHVGLALNIDSLLVYPLILQNPYKQMDHRVFSAKGVINHNDQKNQFLFGDSTKVILGKPRGNMLTFNEGNGKITMEGRFDMDSGFKKNVVFDSFGESSTFTGDKKPITFDLIAGLNIPLPEKCMNIIASDLAVYSDIMPEVDNEKDWVPGALAGLIPNDKRLEKTLTTYQNALQIVLPKEDNYNFFFSKLPMKWNEKLGSFTTAGIVGVGSIAGKTIDRMNKVYIEILMLPTGDIFNLYIESPGEGWYYVSYKNGLVRTVSSNEEYNEVLLSMKKKDSKIKLPNGQSVELTIDEIAAANFFRGRMKANQ